MLSLCQEASLNAVVKDKFLDIHDVVRESILGGSHERSGPEVQIRRLDIISSIDDCILSFEDDAGGLSLYERLKELLTSEVQPIRQLSQSCLLSYFMWKIKELIETRFGLELADVDSLLEKRDDILFILDAQVEEGDQMAATTVVELEIVFTGLSQIESFEEASVRRPIDVNLQRLIVRTLQKELKRYATISGRSLNLSDEISSDEEDDNQRSKSGSSEHDLLTSEHKICSFAGEIVSAIILGKMDGKHAEMLLANKGKLGPSYDGILTELPETLTRKKTGKVKNPSRGNMTKQALNDMDTLMGESGDEIEF